jgi:hypothetical protein
VSPIETLVGLNVTVGATLVTTVVPVKAMLLGFLKSAGSVTAHVKLLTAPDAALKLAGAVHVTASGERVLVGVVVIAAVWGNNAITAAALLTEAVSVRVAGGADKVAKAAAVDVRFTFTANACVTPCLVTDTLNEPVTASGTAVVGRTPVTVTDAVAGTQFTET